MTQYDFNIFLNYIYIYIYVRTCFIAQAQDVWDLGPVSPVQ